MSNPELSFPVYFPAVAAQRGRKPNSTTFGKIGNLHTFGRALQHETTSHRMKHARLSQTAANAQRQDCKKGLTETVVTQLCLAYCNISPLGAFSAFPRFLNDNRGPKGVKEGEEERDATRRELQQPFLTRIGTIVARERAINSPVIWGAAAACWVHQAGGGSRRARTGSTGNVPSTQFPARLRSAPLHSAPLHSTPLHYTPLHYTTLHYTTLHSAQRDAALSAARRSRLRTLDNASTDPFLSLLLDCRQIVKQSSNLLFNESPRNTNKVILVQL